MQVLLILLFVLGVMIVLGHGAWLLLALVFRTIFGGAEQRTELNSRCTSCSGCGGLLRLGDDFCVSCGVRQGTPSDMELLAELATAARQLDRLLNAGTLDLETHRRAMQSIVAERERLTMPLRRETAPRWEERPIIPQSIETPQPMPQPAPLMREPVMPKFERAPIEIVPMPEPSAVEMHIPPPQPRRTFTEMLASFMEESSIKWGELIGGLLIVGCSIALVVSLWSEIASRPLVKFSVFTGLTAGLFGLGFYSAHRWKLPTTSRAVLIISTALAPLNFLAMTAFSHADSTSPWLVISGEVLALGLFLFLVYQASRVIAPSHSWLMAAGVMGPSFSMLMARHWGGSGGALWLGLAPIACYWISAGGALRNLTPDANEDDASQGVDQLYVMLGLASFAALLPFGLLLARQGSLAFTIRQYAPLVSLLAAPAIACAFVLLQRTGAPQSGEHRTAAMSVGLIGSLTALTGLALAWPNPVSVIAAAAINFAICLAVAWFAEKTEFKFAHAGAAAHLALAYVIVCNLFGGNLTSWTQDGARLSGVFVSALSGVALLLLFALFGAVAEWFRRAEKPVEERIYSIAAVAAAAISLLLVTAHGFGRAGDPRNAGVIYAVYAAAAFAIAWRRRMRIASWTGAALSLLAIEQTLAFKFGHALAPYHPTRLSLMVFTSLATAALLLLRRAASLPIGSDRDDSQNPRQADSLSYIARDLYESPLSYSALICSFAVAPALLFGGWMTNGQISLRLLWLAAIWLVIAFVERWPALFAAFQAALTVSVALIVAALMGHRWPGPGMLADLKTLQAQAIALSLLSLGWVAARLLLRKRELATAPIHASDNEIGEWREKQEGARQAEGALSGKLFHGAVLAQCLNPGWPAVDRVVNAALLALMIALSVIGVYAGFVEELLPGQAPWMNARAAAATALGAGSWLLLLSLLLLSVVGLWERFEKRAVLAMQILAACACLLLAGLLAGKFAIGTASALRWLLAAGFAAVSLPVLFRERVERFCAQFSWADMRERSKGLGGLSRGLSFALFAAPVVALTLFRFDSILSLASVGAIAPLLLTLLLPLLLVSLTLWAHGLRERSVEMACAAGLLLNLAVTLGSLSFNVLRDEAIDRMAVIRAIQLNVIVTALFSLSWMAIARWWQWEESKPVIKFQIEAVLLLSLSLLGFADLRLFADPTVNSAIANAMGSVWGWLAMAIAAWAFAVQRELNAAKLRVEHFGVAMLAFGSLVACSLSRLGNDWIAYRALETTAIVTASLVLAMRWVARSGAKDRIARWMACFGEQSAVEIWPATLGIVTFVMMLRGWDSIWWTAGGGVALCLLFAGLSVVTRNRIYGYAAGLMPNLVATRLFSLFDLRGEDELVGFFALNVITLASSSVAFLALDLKAIRREQLANRIPPFHRIAARLVVAAAAAGMSLQLWVLAGGGESLTPHNQLLMWLSLGSAAAALFACLWDDESDFAFRWLYATGLLSIAEGFLTVKPEGRGLIAGSVVALSLYSLLTSALWRKAEWFAPLSRRLRLPVRQGAGERTWSFLVEANSVLAAAVAILSVAAVLGLESMPRRLLAVSASFAIPLSFLLLAKDRRNQRLIDVAVWLSLFGVVLWGWAWLPPPVAGRLQGINRLMIVMLVAEAVVIGYRLIAGQWNKLTSDSPNGIFGAIRGAVRESLPVVATIGLSALGVVLAIETLNYLWFGMALIAWPALFVVMLTLIGLILACIAFALLPGEDPFDLDQRGKARYIYAAELLIAFVLLHARVSMPWLFGGVFQAWWPLVVMVVAFAGVGLSELFRRQGRQVLAEPLERTGILLPMLPVVAFWTVDSHVPFSGLLLLVGMFYGMLSVMRRSFTFGLLSAMAGNGGLWHFLGGEAGVGFFEHPQLWLIPMALSVLLAARINRDRLSADQRTSIRYACLITVYVSSTADIFINGAVDSPWLTIVLAVLSVAGVAGGIALRVRAFLFLGTAFLLLAVVTMIRTASVNLGWNWLWYVTGIVFGVLILYTFAMFERKRGEMMAMLERLKQWQA